MGFSTCLPRRNRKPVLLGLALLAACIGRASAAETNILHYTARLHGVGLLDITFCLRLEAASYSAGIVARTIGLADMLVHGRSEGRVDGVIDGVRVKPRAYAEHSRLSGEDYATEIDYPAGSPVLKTLIPAQTKYRQPVPADALGGAIDGLSAVAMEALVATRTGTCQGGALVYDGRQLRRATTRPGGRDVLAPSTHSAFSGPALRCDTESVMLAGFLKSEAIKAQQKPRHSSAWLAPALPGGPDVPVKITFDADFLGDIIVDLDAVTQNAGGACPN
jgi:hypothetical protein